MNAKLHHTSNNTPMLHIVPDNYKVAASCYWSVVETSSVQTTTPFPPSTHLHSYQIFLTIVLT